MKLWCQIGAPNIGTISALCSLARTLVYQSFKKQHEVDTHIVVYYFLKHTGITFVFTVDNITLNDIPLNYLTIKALKYSRRGRQLRIFEYRTHKDKKLCAIVCLE